jgi:hypothetical protein
MNKFSVLAFTCLVPLIRPALSSILLASTALAATPGVVKSALPVLLVPTPDQNDNAVAFAGRPPDVMTGSQPASLVVGLPGKTPGQIEIDFVGAQLSDPQGIELQKSQTNYPWDADPANWRTHVPNCAKVAYLDLYPGIDATFYGAGHQVEHDFVVAPGADYQQIHIHFSRDARVSVGKDGGLSITVEDVSLQMLKPVVYEEAEGKRREKKAAYRLLPDGDISFIVANYNPRHKLIIDPVLSF